MLGRVVMAAAVAALAPAPAGAGARPAEVLIRGATVVTMDDGHNVIRDGRVLVRHGRIAAVWHGEQPPRGIDLGDPDVIEAGDRDLLFPGLINLHSHPAFNVLHAWPAPASHAIPAQGKAGSDPYANRYQWGGASPATAPLEHRRLVTNAAGVVSDAAGLGLQGEIVKYAEVAALLGGETAIQGAPANPESDGVLIRNVDRDPRVAPPRVASIDLFAGNELENLRAGLAGGAYDAWLVHLAEGVRDADRRPGDPISSRAEFATLETKGLLTDRTVIVHGSALERADFARMRLAGAKLVWSPLSNLLLYGTTTDVRSAMSERVPVSLGTDWTPSGSRTLLGELKIASDLLRDERARTLADMVTRNPAQALGRSDELGSIEAGKLADLVLLRRSRRGDVYRALVEASERDVALVLVGGDPLAGEPELMRRLKPGDHELVTSAAGGFGKAVDVTTAAPVPEGGETLAAFTAELAAGLAGLGDLGYLKARVAGGAAAGLPDPIFRALLAAQVGLRPDGSLNLEAVGLLPLFAADDDFFGHLLRGDVDPLTGLIADPTPPFELYPANLNHLR